MERVGLAPAGENGTWFQTVGMVEQTLEEHASDMTFNGGASGEPFPLVLREDTVLWSKKQDRTKINWQDSELVFVGYGIVAPEYGWNDYEGLDVEGKTVVMLVNDPGLRKRRRALQRQGDDLLRVAGHTSLKKLDGRVRRAQSSFTKPPQRPTGGKSSRTLGLVHWPIWSAPTVAQIAPCLSLGLPKKRPAHCSRRLD